MKRRRALSKRNRTGWGWACSTHISTATTATSQLTYTNSTESIPGDRCMKLSYRGNCGKCTGVQAFNVHPSKESMRNFLGKRPGQTSSGGQNANEKRQQHYPFRDEIGSTSGSKGTYARLVAELWPHKKEVHRVWVTVRGYKLDYMGVTATQTANLTTTKYLVNSNLPTDKSKFMFVDW